MYKMNSRVRGLVKTNPLPLSFLKDEKAIQFANSFLKRKTGFEIEAHIRNFDIDGLTQACQSFCTHQNHDTIEMRFQLDTGINGLIGLYKVAEQLRKRCLFNTQSGIHYHIDFPEMKDTPAFFIHRLIAKEKSTILNSLLHWNYKGGYNKWNVSQFKEAVRFHAYYNTIEFRIGEMTFDYEVLIKRILNCQNIVHQLALRLKNITDESRFGSPIRENVRRRRN